MTIGMALVAGFCCCLAKALRDADKMGYFECFPD
jgi:hypothetical protein